MAEVFEYYAGGRQAPGAVVPTPTTGWAWCCGSRSVCGLIVPWNFLMLIATWEARPALACGNAESPSRRR